MSHHSDQEFKDLKEMAEKLDLGPTGAFPEGKLNEDDKGELQLAIGTQDGKVIMSFGIPVSWIGFSSQQARQIAATLLEASAVCLTIGREKK